MLILTTQTTLLEPITNGKRRRKIVISNRGANTIWIKFLTDPGIVALVGEGIPVDAGVSLILDAVDKELNDRIIAISETASTEAVPYAWG